MTLPTSNQQRAVITIVQMNVSISYWKKALYLLIDKCPQIASNLASFSSMFLTVCCCSVKENRKYVLHYIFLGLVIDRKFKKKMFTNFVVIFFFFKVMRRKFINSIRISLLSDISQVWALYSNIFWSPLKTLPVWPIIHINIISLIFNFEI